MRRLREKLVKGELTGRESIRLARKGEFNPHTTIRLDRRYSKSENNIGNLPHGDIDAIVTSPPYSEGIGHDSGDNASAKFEERLEMQQRYTRQMVSEGNIAKLKHGEIDAIITSPPYSGSVNAPNDPERRAERMRKAGLDPGTIVGGKARCGQVDWRYGESEGQIGKLAHGKIDAVITSPPYSECPGSVYEGLGQRVEKLYQQGKITKDQYEHFKGRTSYFERAAEAYPKSKGQIGELPHGEIDAVITSPPYSDGYSIREGGQVCKEYVERRREKLIQQGREDIAKNLKVFEYNTRNPANI